MTGLVVGGLVALALLVRPASSRRLRRPGRRSATAALPPVRADAGDGEPVDPALVLDLTAAALASGSPPHTALSVVGAAVGGELGRALGQVAARLRLGSPWDEAWSAVPGSLEPLRRTLALALATGAPAATILRDAAGDARRRRHRQAQAAAARLGVRMVLPLGLCSLPAFVVWAVVPVVLSLAGGLLSR